MDLKVHDHFWSCHLKRQSCCNAERKQIYFFGFMYKMLNLSLEELRLIAKKKETSLTTKVYLKVNY